MGISHILWLGVERDFCDILPKTTYQPIDDTLQISPPFPLNYSIKYLNFELLKKVYFAVANLNIQRAIKYMVSSISDQKASIR